MRILCHVVNSGYFVWMHPSGRMGVTKIPCAIGSRQGLGFQAVIIKNINDAINGFNFLQMYVNFEFSATVLGLIMITIFWMIVSGLHRQTSLS